MRLPFFRAVIFDMDGLALDTEAAYAAAWCEASRQFGVELDRTFCQTLFGRHADDVARALREAIGEGFDRERFNRRAASCWREHIRVHGVAKMPGLDELSETLRRAQIPYALATNSDAPYALECLDKADARTLFPLVVSRDQVQAGKPAPDLIVEAARRLGVRPEQCLVLEDSETGLLAARAAGAMPVLVSSRPAPPALRSLATAAFGSLMEIGEVIAAAENAAPYPACG